MNGTYSQTPKKKLFYTSEEILYKVATSVMALLMLAISFMPFITYSYFHWDKHISLFELLKNCVEVLTAGVPVYDDTTYKVAITFLIPIMIILICIVGMVLFCWLKYNVLFRVLSLLCSILNLFAVLALLMIIRINISLISSSAELGIGVLILIIPSLLSVIFTAFGIPAGKKEARAVQAAYYASANMTPAFTPASMQATPVDPLMPISPEGYENFDAVSEPSFDLGYNAPSDDAKTIAQFGVLEGLNGDYASASIKILPGEVLTIGRDSKLSNIVIASEKVSRRHCTVEYDALNRCYIVTDLSSNGTIINHSQPLPRNIPTSLQPGTELSIANEKNTFRLN